MLLFLIAEYACQNGHEIDGEYARGVLKELILDNSQSKPSQTLPKVQNSALTGPNITSCAEIALNDRSVPSGPPNDDGTPANNTTSTQSDASETVLPASTSPSQSGMSNRENTPARPAKSVMWWDGQVLWGGEPHDDEQQESAATGSSS